MQQIITIERTMLNKYCTIFCHTCETNTRHALGCSGQIYVCGLCGSVIDIEIEDEEDETI